MSAIHDVSPRLKTLAFGLIVAISALVLLPTDVTFAQRSRGTAEQRHACRPDSLRFCRGMRSDDAVELCLRSNMHGLRPACRHVFEHEDENSHP
jgi:hypothetical protein